MTFRTVGTLLALTVVLSGCTAGEGDPTVLPPAPSASSSAPAAPSPPPEAAAETAAGASAFARYYLEVLGRALQSADPSQVKALSDSGCGGCQNLIGAVEDARSKGQHVREADFQVLFAAAPPVQDGDVVVDLRYERLEGELLDADGIVVSPIPPEKALDAQMRLMRMGKSWIVLGFRSVSGT